MSSTTANLTNVNFMSKERFDNLSTINDDELYAVKIDNIDNAESIINQNENENPVKMWTGTRAEYNTLVTNDEIDDDTLYNITDDGDVTLNLLQTIYPIGAIYIGTMSVCPLSALFGTWELVSGGRVLQGSDSNHLANTTIEAGLPALPMHTTNNEVSGYGLNTSASFCDRVLVDNLYTSQYTYAEGIYGNSNTVQPPVFVVNIWKRTA